MRASTLSRKKQHRAFFVFTRMRLPVLAILLLALPGISSPKRTFTVSGDKPATKENIKEKITQRPVRFLENKGQMCDQTGKPVPFVLFRVDAPGMELYITEKGLTYVFSQQEEEPQEKQLPDPFRPAEYTIKALKVKQACIEMSLKGASIKKENVVYGASSPHSFNYFFAHCPGGIYGAKEYDSLVIRNIYPGIDWVLYNSKKSGFKYDLLVHPGADAGQIELVYATPQPLHLIKNGDLSIPGVLGSLTEQAPYSYLKESAEAIPCTFKLASSTRFEDHYETSVRFDLLNLKKTAQTLVIDPQLTWNTFYSSNNIEYVYDITTDQYGSLFAVGSTLLNSNFPLKNSGTFFQGGSALLAVAPIILKFDNSGVLLWATFYGTSGNGLVGLSYAGYRIETDNSGNVFVLGLTADPLFPLQNAGTYFQPVLKSNPAGPPNDLFILKFDNNGNRLWATFYGGSREDYPVEMDIDPSGNVHIAGRTGSTDFPLQNSGGYFQSTFSGTVSHFVLKFDNAGNRLWSTYFANDLANVFSLACDQSGNTFLTGNCIQSSGIPLLNPGGGAYYQASAATPTTGLCFISKFSAGGALSWSTFYGGNGGALGICLSIDKHGNVFVLGNGGLNLPVQNAGTYFQPSMNGIADPFILKFTNSGARLWATYYGGTGNEYPVYSDIVADTCGDVYVVFATYNNSSILTQQSPDGGYFQPSAPTALDIAHYDAFLTRFSNSGALIWSSYYGGNGSDIVRALATDTDNNLFAAGVTGYIGSLSTYSMVNPGGGAYFDGTGQGPGYDMFFGKFEWPKNLMPGPTAFFYAGPLCMNTPAVFPATAVGFIGGGTYSATPGLNVDPATGMIVPALSSPGTYTVSYSGAMFGCTPLPALTTTVVINTISAVNTSSAAACSGNSATLSVSPAASGGATYSWSPGNSSTSTLVASATVSTTYTVNGIDGNGCAFTVTTALQVHPLPSIVVAGDKTVCLNASVTQTASGASSYTWSAGAASSTISMNPVVSTVYSVSGTDINNCRNTSTVLISVRPLPTLSPVHVTVCAGSSVQLSGGPPFAGQNYTWMPTGATTPSIVVSPSAIQVYSVVADLNGCKQSAQSTVTPIQPEKSVTGFSYATPFCINGKDPLPVKAPNFNTGGNFSSAGNISLNTTSGLIDLSVTVPGTYTVSYHFSAPGCRTSGSSSTTVDIHPVPVLQLAPEQVMAPGSSTTLQLSGGTSFTWSPSEGLSCSDCPTPVASPPESKEYCVLASNGSCVNEACILVNVTCDAGHDLSVPNAFTPNGDGLNESFCLQGWNFCLEQFSIMIFNRWGEQVFGSTDPNFCWDGIYNGKLLNADVFVYQVKAVFTGKRELSKKGNITLLR